MSVSRSDVFVRFRSIAIIFLIPLRGFVSASVLLKLRDGKAARGVNVKDVGIRENNYDR